MRDASAFTRVFDALRPRMTSQTLCSLVLFSGPARCRLITAGDRPKGDIDVIGAVDGDDRHRELDQFLLAELRARLFKHLVGHIARAQQRQRFRPGKRGALALAVEGTFAPGAQDRPLPLQARP